MDGASSTKRARIPYTSWYCISTTLMRYLQPSSYSLFSGLVAPQRATLKAVYSMEEARSSQERYEEQGRDCPAYKLAICITTPWEFRLAECTLVCTAHGG